MESQTVSRINQKIYMVTHPEIAQMTDCVSAYFKKKYFQYVLKYCFSDFVLLSSRILRVRQLPLNYNIVLSNSDITTNNQRYVGLPLNAPLCLKNQKKERMFKEPEKNELRILMIKPNRVHGTDFLKVRERDLLTN